MKSYKLGIDIGSTTAKLLLIDPMDTIAYSEYIRHNTRIIETLLSMLERVLQKYNNIYLQAAFSGSTAMGITEKTDILFIQEVVAAASLVDKQYPTVKSLIDIGGEDAKLVLFKKETTPDIRMNGNCAGGTGAYIDQMAALLNISIEELNNAAWNSTKIYPIASRCGVFAKTDVQNLTSRKINTADIAASIFDAVASQLVNALARGCSIEPDILFCGGPLTYISYLRKSFSSLLKIDSSNIILPERAELFTVYGTALSIPSDQKIVSLSELIKDIKSIQIETSHHNTLKVLFNNKQEISDWENTRNIIKINESDIIPNETYFLGIDSGSTTTKATIINSSGDLVYTFYKNNNGHPLEAIIESLNTFSNQLKDQNIDIKIGKAAVTGYGEELIKSALAIDYGIVETIAHFIAAQTIEPNVSFILDIGGQDIKAIFVKNGTVSNIEINEACSSGCGSFIEGFANTLGFTPTEFSNHALDSTAPYDLGSRCTVFMNSKVKQALRDGATVQDLSAGLAYSVVKNCLNKVLRIKNNSEIGDNIVVQGGTFKNNAVFRSLEILSNKKIVISDKPELMGAYGAALFALNKSLTEGTTSTFIGFSNLSNSTNYSTKYSICKGCTNNCQITTHKFPHNKDCFLGNKCEKIFTNNSSQHLNGKNIFDYKRKLLFDRNSKTYNTNNIRIGIPRILNMYENYPFWHSLLSECGFKVELSDESNNYLYKKGIGSLMSENICFPAKLSHGHIVNLIEKQVDRIFFPFVIYEKKCFKKTVNSFNCPIVTAYSEVLKNTTLVPDSKHIPFDSPAINFNNKILLKKACWNYIKKFGVNKSTFDNAFKISLEVQDDFKNQIKTKNFEILNEAINNKELVILLASHPYHIDHLIHQQVSQILSDLGVNVINEELSVDPNNEGFEAYYSVSQWEYPNRILQAAWWVSQQKYNIGLIQLNSFGCGPDSFMMDEISDLAQRSGLSFALVRIDEISSPGSIKLRLRSMVESIKLKIQKEKKKEIYKPEKNDNFVFEKSDSNRTILVPWFSDFYSPLVPMIGKLTGYKLEKLPPSDKQSIELGLEYVNNEVCYPATLVVGDILRALKNNKYNINEIAIGITQTGGQCRATNYISLIKRAMLNAGYGNVPVVSLATVEGMINNQPGFTPNWLKLIKPIFLGLLFADSLSRLYYSTISQEETGNISRQLKDKYLGEAQKILENQTYNQFLPLLESAVEEFNMVPVFKTNVQAVGIVGEIYLKYNSFGQFNIIDWLIENHIEVSVPPLMEFLMQTFVNKESLKDSFIIQQKAFNLLNKLSEWGANYFITKYEKILEQFRFYRPVNHIHDLANLASEIVSLNNQYGEGWLIPAGLTSFSKQNINHAICIQPFGCIANHIVGKGIETKIKSLYPNMNILFLDFDSGTSKVNILNRLHFLIQNISKKEKSLSYV